jgi:hypothetical protein
MNNTSNSVTDFVKSGLNMKQGFSNFVDQPNLANMPAGAGKFSNFLDAAGTYQAIKIKENRKSNFLGDGENVLFEYSNSENPGSGIKITTRDKNSLSTATKLRFGIGLCGSVAGILVAVHRKSGFWGGVGWWIVGGMAGGALGWIVTSGMKEDK